MSSERTKIIFFGNGMLAEYALKILERDFEVVFHARTKEDLKKAHELKLKNPEIHGILASYGVMVPENVLEAFEPEGILNIHPSLLPAYRGASPIESAILDGALDFSVSIMKLAKAMDAGPIYYQTTLLGAEIAEKANSKLVSGLIPEKQAIYEVLAETGTEWICQNLRDLPEPTLQDDLKATFCGKLTKSMGALTPELDTAEETLRKIIAFSGFPKAKYTFFGIFCIVHEAHILKSGETAVLSLPCADGRVLSIDCLQPEGRKVMGAKSFVNGYKK
ncbi:hypothetical protein IJI29_03910 [Candidatus Saccharibacteria bacterium]|nr:hypothetical protein [Candidatus Saccharibacteria bacterium]